MPLSTFLAAFVLLHPASADNYRFVLYGDCRDGHAAHRKVVALTMKENPAFVIQTGDLVARGSQDELWKIYDDITGDMRKKIPVYPARGNHDFGGAGYDARFTVPTESGTKQYYTFTRGRWRFICLDVDEHTAYEESSEQYSWLVSELDKAKGSKLDIAVFFHVPPYSIGSHGSNLEVRSALCPLFEKYGVSLVMNGHDHLFYRTTRNGVVYIVSGGGGAPLHPGMPEKGAIYGDKWLDANHLVVFDVDGDHMKGKALKADGSAFDSFELTAKAPVAAGIR
ncbi:MAG: metallophosphoesterase family protein [Fimbriimonadales bacterium]